MTPTERLGQLAADAALDTYRVQLQRGEALSLTQGRALLAYVDKLRAQPDDNMDRLVKAREAFDRFETVPPGGEIADPAQVVQPRTSIEQQLRHIALGTRPETAGRSSQF